MACNCRTVLIRKFPLANGRLVSVILRDRLSCDDPYVNLTRATALSLRTGETFNSDRINRSIKDILIKTNISI
jgi:hypothetical protein